MSPIRRIRFDIRADTEPTTTLSQGGGAEPTRVLRLVQDTIKPLAPTFVTIPEKTTAAPETATTKPSTSNSGMSNATKLGLGLIPVVVVMVGLYILFLFWYRRRRAARKQSRVHKTTKYPPVPEKDISSYNSSIASRLRSSKVLSMTAFSSPVPQDGRYPYVQPLDPNGTNLESEINKAIAEIQISAILPPSGPTIFEPRREIDAKRDVGMQINVAAATSHSGSVEDSLDSPIDGSSPFRLKRGDTVKRHSLGPDMFRLWPTPPMNVYSQESRSTVRGTSSIYTPRASRAAQPDVWSNKPWSA